ncbi:hypothetical protein GCM10018789_36980 [Streptomyces werraensis]|nr:hypothetical protein GCM10018789_36980 [Streptomyces werraensis]
MPWQTQEADCRGAGWTVNAASRSARVRGCFPEALPARPDGAVATFQGTSGAVDSAHGPVVAGRTA